MGCVDDERNGRNRSTSSTTEEPLGKGGTDRERPGQELDSHRYRRGPVVRGRIRLNGPVRHPIPQTVNGESTDAGNNTVSRNSSISVSVELHS